ncbi:hypothetical protein [Microtetraspora sp. NBRC 13810]|uniref:hypothetical protein n=1 Tax=Microtetraspora sp. NBRC 13810 TaxID=3030990 RepID=UPI002553CA0F|nr:hypothetical protein [Microtetraspora sp. NBRC 13810]
MPASETSGATALRAGVRGTIGAMAMSGMRQAATSLGLVHTVPPEAVLERTVPGLFRLVPQERHQAMIEFVHWAYGAGGGAFFGLLPRAVRERPWAGPAYGVAIWGVFEAGIAPLLGVPRRRGTAVERCVLLADHLLYGIVVAASPWPHRD